MFRFPADIEGYMSESECRALYDLACQAPSGAIVELGTYKGRSAVAMAQAWRRVYAVDRFSAEAEEFNPYPDHRDGKFSAALVRANAEHYGVDVVPLEGDSVWRGLHWDGGPIALLLIDADHAYQAVRADFETWAPFVMPDGVIVFDDSLWDGPMRLLMELTAWGPVPGPQVGGLTAMRRITEAVHA